MVWWRIDWIPEDLVLETSAFDHFTLVHCKRALSNQLITRNFLLFCSLRRKMYQDSRHTNRGRGIFSIRLPSLLLMVINTSVMVPLHSPLVFHPRRVICPTSDIPLQCMVTRHPTFMMTDSTEGEYILWFILVPPFPRLLIDKSNSK